ncbi:MAG TPA: DUF2156 domain-containing protein [Clostridiales bacterium]|nr:DUF2156 domain-containing protein [Clostridiales bacterium]
MLEFEPIKLSDKFWIDPIVKAENSRSADYSFANIYIWNKRFNQQVAKCNERFIVMPMYAEKPFFVYPVGSGDLAPVINEMRLYAEAHGFPFTMRGVTVRHMGELNNLFPKKFDFFENRDYYDYIYTAEKLATLSGKKLHGKRNHINRFLESNDWSFEPLTPKQIPECMAMLENWTEMNRDKLDQGLLDEHDAIIRAFENYRYLGLEGGILRSGGRIIAFTVGEKISGDTYDIHFEKAYSDIQGAYPMVNREFVRLIRALHPEIIYINREDDMGHENLRRAKLSYYPEFLIEKYTAIWRS